MLKIPENIITKQDLIKIHRELRGYMDKINQSILRHKKADDTPLISDKLLDIAQINQINLQDDSSCNYLLDQLDALMKNSPIIHVSFPSEPPQDLVKSLIKWFRKEVNQNIFFVIGLQPSITAGIIIRTKNKQFDFSLRSSLAKKEPTLLEAIKI